MKKVCILTNVHTPFDTRIFHKEAKTLVRADYEVTLIAQHNKNEVIEGIKIIALPKPRNRFMRIFGLTWRVFYLGLCQRADIYHFHDPELIFIGILLKLFGKRAIYDVHELVYFQIEDKSWLRYRIIKKLIQSIYLLFESLSIRFFNQIVLAETKYEDWFKEKHKNFLKYTIVRNLPILKLIDNNTKYISHKKSKLVVIYIGGLSKIRGIKEIIQSVEHIDDGAELWLLGQWESEKFKKECENLAGWKYTKYLGHKSLEEVYGCLKISKVGISILYPVKNYLTSLPVKIFEYMACSLPVIMSNFPYWQEIFGDCALFVDPYDSKDIAEKISYLLDNPNEAKELGKKGRKLIEEKYSWETESKKLLEMYNNL